MFTNGHCVAMLVWTTSDTYPKYISVSKQNYKINLISNLAAGGIYAMKIIYILRFATRGRRIVAANLIGHFGSVTCGWRSRCNESHWHFGPCYIKMKVQIQLNLLAFRSLLLEGWEINTTNPVGILGPLHEDGGAGATKFIEVLVPVAWRFGD